MKYRLFAIFLALVMLFSAIPAMATESTEPASTERAPGYCGDAIMWSFSGGTLILTGAGAMDDFPDGAPWAEHKGEISKVIISGGITYIGAYSFSDYDRLTSVQFGGDLVEIGERAFFSCDGLTSISLPQSFTTFGPCSFMGCTRLKEIHCEGVFPHFRLNCLWDTWCTIYFPADRPWPLDEIINLEEAFHGRVEFLASDGTDPYEPSDSNEAPQPPSTEKPTTDPTTEPTTTVPPTTEAPTTEAPTTEAPTTEPPATEAPTTIPPTTEDPATVPSTTETPTEEVIEPASSESETNRQNSTKPLRPAEKPEVPESSRGFLVGALLIAALVVVLILVLRFFGGGQKKGKYSR